MQTLCRTMIAALLSILVVHPGRADDWPTFGGNPARTGYTKEQLPAQLARQWVWKASGKPAPAWPVSSRMPFDRAFHPVVAGGAVYFGSSADGKVYALDAASGKQRWTYCTDAPVRFAPAVWKDSVFVVSDDGHLYCLTAKDGKLLWKKRGGPDGRMILGNDRMVSRWPARGGPAVVDGVVYFAAGIWPSEGIYLHALDADTGKVVWTNDSSGSIYMGQPHGGAFADSGVSAQGYLVAAGERLLVPTGRAVPAVFERATGKFRYFHLQENGHKGGSSTLATGDWFVNAGVSFNAATGKALDPVGKGEVAVMPDGLVCSTAKDLAAYRWADKTKTDRKGQVTRYKGLEKSWTMPNVPSGAAVIVAGKSVLCGGDKRVTVVDSEAKKVVQTLEVDGTAFGLAFSEGRLFAGTDQGSVWCFAAGDTGVFNIYQRHRPRPLVEENGPRAAAAEEILRKSGVTEGYCVDLGCGDGELACELATRSKLHIYAIDSDSEKVAVARRKLTEMGLYGRRVTVHHGDPAATSYPRYFADLVVSGRAITDGTSPALDKETARLQRPFGGVACVGKAGAIQKTVRGPLAGAGSWTHQYADPANTCCSPDSLVKGPLGMLWFRDSDFEMPQRHGRGPAPLFLNGRLFVEGLNGIRAVDAYNGRPLWDYSLPGVLKPYDGEHLVGTAVTHSNFCVTDDALYVRTGSRCLRLDVATGKKLAEFQAPLTQDGKPAPWGFLACENGLLFGSLADTKHVVKHAYGKADMSQQFSESVAFFALDAKTGERKWMYNIRHSLRHNAIAIGGGRVYLIDRPVAEKDRTDGDKKAEHARGELLALDSATGKVLWRKTEDIYGTLLALGTAHDVLLMGYQPTRFKQLSEIGGALTGFRASDGKRLWEQKANYITRPVLNDRTVYAQGGAWDIVTGEVRPFAFKRSYGCGQLAGCTNLMVFRSATLAYYDVARQKGSIDYGGIRPGCWINAIPAGGLVLVPDASSGCQCSYLNQAWIALQPME